MEQDWKWRLDLLSERNSALVLVDYQPSMIRGIASWDKVTIKEAAYCAAKAASILSVPVVLSAINPKLNGEFFKEISALFPNQEVHVRKMPSFDAFEDGPTF
ncbi:MAG: isochorismatase, partial [Methanomassiliicoccales archaeon]